MIITKADVFGDKGAHGVVFDKGDIDLPACKECGEPATLYQGFRKGHLFFVATMGSEIPEGLKPGYVYLCITGCQEMVGPCPTISLLNDLWRMRNE